MIDYTLIYSLYNQKGLGRVKINNLITQAFSISNKENININTSIIKELNNLKIEKLDYYQKTKIKELEDKLKMQVNFIDLIDTEYPKELNILANNRPTILSCIGNIDLLKAKKIGFCGSRKASEKGHDIAKDISEQVSSKNITVVSGYASGIDMETHYTSLKNGGTTIIVLPEGIKNFKIKRSLKEVWDWKNILVISEFVPDAIWSVNRAMERNATIVALSNIMVLIEARITGGSIDAGYKTLQFNKPLFAPVYDGMPEEASGNTMLLRKGAFPLKKSKETNRANLHQMFEILTSRSNFNKNLFE